MSRDCEESKSTLEWDVRANDYSNFVLPDGRILIVQQLIYSECGKLLNVLSSWKNFCKQLDFIQLSNETSERIESCQDVVDSVIFNTKHIRITSENNSTLVCFNENRSLLTVACYSVNNEKYLQIDQLVSSPMSIINRHDSSLTKGGTVMMQAIEAIAVRESLYGIRLCAYRSALSFYLKMNFQLMNSDWDNCEVLSCEKNICSENQEIASSDS